MIDPRFQGVNRLFVLSFENAADGTAHKGYYLPKLEIKKYLVMSDGEKYFDQRVKSYINSYENIRKIIIGQGDDYTNGCLLGGYLKRY